jgi:hypothetical protein
MYAVVMQTKRQLLRRSCLWVGLVECLLAVGVVAALHSSDLGPVVLLAGLVNFPGLLLTLQLGLPPWTDITSSTVADPVGGWIFWVMIVWSILIKRHLG